MEKAKDSICKKKGEGGSTESLEKFPSPWMGSEENFESSKTTLVG